MFVVFCLFFFFGFGLVGHFIAMHIKQKQRGFTQEAAWFWFWFGWRGRGDVMKNSDIWNRHWMYRCELSRMNTCDQPHPKNTTIYSYCICSRVSCPYEMQLIYEFLPRDRMLIKKLKYSVTQLSRDPQTQLLISVRSCQYHVWVKQNESKT